MCDEETNQNTARSQDTPVLKEVLIIYLLSAVLYLFSSFLLAGLGDQIQEKYLLITLLISQLAFVIAPPVLYTIWQNYNVSHTFFIAPITFKTVGLTVVTTGAAFVLIGVIARFQEMVFPHSQDYQEIWEQILRQFQQTPFILTFALVSILPGVCEEIFFRGFLLQGIRKKFSDKYSIVLVGVLFGLLHFDPYRFVPVTLLGILFGYMVVKTGSIFPGMIAHITNNTIAISISYVILTFQEYDIPPPEDISLLQTISSLIFLAAIVAIALTVFIIGLRALPQTSENGQPGVRFETQEINFEDRKSQNEE